MRSLVKKMLNTVSSTLPFGDQTVVQVLAEEKPRGVRKPAGIT